MSYKWGNTRVLRLSLIYTDPGIIKTIKISQATLDWTYYEDVGRRPEGSSRAGRPKLRWLEDLTTLGIRGWRRRALDRDRWKS